MRGVLLNGKIEYLYAKLRYFGENEHHVSRLCNWDVLLLVFDGVLRFEEDGISYEVYPGEYFIQHNGGRQSGIRASDAPKYLFIHFLAEWGEGTDALPKTGKFNYADMRQLISDADTFSDDDALMTEKYANLYSILNCLYRGNAKRTLVQRIADKIKASCTDELTLDMLCNEFHFSKNYIIRLFFREYGVTPIEYLNAERLKRAEYLLEVTSYSAERISSESGYNSYSHFYRQFCRKNGISPTEWRMARRKMLM